MSYIREDRRKIDAKRKALPHRILVIEDSAALAMLLKQRLEADAGAEVLCCDSMASAKTLLNDGPITLALTGLNLPDAPKGEILALLTEHRIPTIVCTATFNPEARRRYAENKIIDYIIKDGRRTVDVVVATVDRIISNRQYSVLVVDDARSVRSELTEIFTRQNFNVREAHSGAQALKILSEDDAIQLVVTDYHMPDMDGYELTRRIRETRSSEDLRIIGVSSSTDRLLSARFLKAGASDFIYMPFVPEELQCRIDNNIETLNQLKRLRYLAERDHLTDLPNRRYFFDKTRSLVDNINKGRNIGSIAIIDIDHFKKINDTLGHDAGDGALQNVSKLLADMCEEGGHMPARLGGEEFAIVLKGLDARAAYGFCEKLRARIEARGTELTESDMALTVSIGVVEIEKGEPFDNQLNAADQLLYMAKAAGRNRVFSDVILMESMAQMNATA